MDISDKVAQPSMEEILASIRRIIAEEPGVSSAHDGKSGGNGDGSVAAPIVLVADQEPLDEGGDFELPSMFRPASVPAGERPTPVFSRLSDALRHTVPEPQPIAFPQFPSFGVQVQADPGTAPANGARPVTPLPSLSSLRSPRLDAAAHEAFQANSASQDAPMPLVAPIFPQPEAAAPATSEEPVKRVMAPFKDTRFSKMSGPAPSAPAAAAASPPVPPPAAPVAEPQGLAAFPSNPSLAVEAPAFNPAEMAPPAAQTSAITPPPMPGSLEAALVSALQSAEAPLAPMYNPGAAPVAGNGSIEDTTAELLRPMLRQWLSENMPRMVEKALFIEVAESVKSGRPSTH